VIVVASVVEIVVLCGDSVVTVIDPIAEHIIGHQLLSNN
jgi:hypothetical protein